MILCLLSISSEEQRFTGPKVAASTAGKGPCESVDTFISPTASAPKSFTVFGLSLPAAFICSCWFVPFHIC